MVACLPVHYVHPPDPEGLQRGPMTPEELKAPSHCVYSRQSGMERSPSETQAPDKPPLKSRTTHQ
eukprot:2998695-Pyramimonas_sp.AAC.1